MDANCIVPIEDGIINFTPQVCFCIFETQLLSYVSYFQCYFFAAHVITYHMSESPCYWIMQLFLKGGSSRQDFTIKAGGIYQVQGCDHPVMVCGIRCSFEDGLPR